MITAGEIKMRCLEEAKCGNRAKGQMLFLMGAEIDKKVMADVLLLDICS